MSEDKLEELNSFTKEVWSQLLVKEFIEPSVLLGMCKLVKNPDRKFWQFWKPKFIKSNNKSATIKFPKFD